MNQPQAPTVVLAPQSEDTLSKNILELPCCKYLTKTGNNYRDLIKACTVKDIVRELLNPVNLITYGTQANEKQYPKEVIRISDN